MLLTAQKHKSRLTPHVVCDLGLAQHLLNSGHDIWHRHLVLKSKYASNTLYQVHKLIHIHVYLYLNICICTPTGMHTCKLVLTNFSRGNIYIDVTNPHSNKYVSWGGRARKRAMARMGTHNFVPSTLEPKGLHAYS